MSRAYLATPPNAPGKPYLQRSFPGGLLVRWEAPEAAVTDERGNDLGYKPSFRLQCSSGWGSWGEAHPDIAGCQYMIMDLDPGGSYKVRVRAETPAGHSAWAISKSMRVVRSEAEAAQQAAAQAESKAADAGSTAADAGVMGNLGAWFWGSSSGPQGARGTASGAGHAAAPAPSRPAGAADGAGAGSPSAPQAPPRQMPPSRPHAGGSSDEDDDAESIPDEAEPYVNPFDTDDEDEDEPVSIPQLRSRADPRVPPRAQIHAPNPFDSSSSEDEIESDSSGLSAAGGELPPVNTYSSQAARTQMQREMARRAELELQVQRLQGAAHAIADMTIGELEHLEQQLSYALERVRDKKEQLRREEEDNRPETELCVVCQDNPKTVLILPCRHLCLCGPCNAMDVMKTCPLCRTEIESTMQVFT